jgi:ArsR family transcriptional regulator, cadmium/lead-responsive transcriptional repressor
MTMPDVVAVAPRQELRPAAALFHSLSDATRLAIVQHLAGGEARVVDLTERLGSAQSTVSAHLACLRDCGLVVGRPVGRQMFYSLTRPELLDLLAAAETLLEATGSVVALCPNFGTSSSTGSGTRSAGPADAEGVEVRGE